MKAKRKNLFNEEKYIFLTFNAKIHLQSKFLLNVYDIVLNINSLGIVDR